MNQLTHEQIQAELRGVAKRCPTVASACRALGWDEPRQYSRAYYAAKTDTVLRRMFAIGYRKQRREAN